LFIDLDAKSFVSDNEFQHALKRILKKIGSLLYDVKPLVIWSGHGYHIIIPVNAKEALENFEDFTSYTIEPSKAFLQFAEKHLSLNKADTANNPGFKSCLIRVPHTLTHESKHKLGDTKAWWPSLSKYDYEIEGNQRLSFHNQILASLCHCLVLFL
jgi:hypothetical protein